MSFCLSVCTILFWSLKHIAQCILWCSWYFYIITFFLFSIFVIFMLAQTNHSQFLVCVNLLGYKPLFWYRTRIWQNVELIGFTLNLYIVNGPGKCSAEFGTWGKWINRRPLLCGGQWSRGSVCGPGGTQSFLTNTLHHIDCLEKALHTNNNTNNKEWQDIVELIEEDSLMTWNKSGEAPER